MITRKNNCSVTGFRLFRDEWISCYYTSKYNVQYAKFYLYPSEVRYWHWNNRASVSQATLKSIGHFDQ